MEDMKSLSDLSDAELLQEIQSAGLEIDELRAYRKEVTEEYDKRMLAKSLREHYGSHLDDDDVAKINAIISVKKISSNTEVNNGKRTI